MQTLTSTLLAAQQSQNQVPYVSATAYFENLSFPEILNSNFIPPGTGENIVMSDSCYGNFGSGIGGPAILESWITETSTSTFNWYYRVTQLSGGYNPPPTPILLDTNFIPSGSVPNGCSITTDVDTNSTSSSFIISVSYGSNSTHVVLVCPSTYSGVNGGAGTIYNTGTTLVGSAGVYTPFNGSEITFIDSTTNRGIHTFMYVTTINGVRIYCLGFTPFYYSSGTFEGVDNNGNLTGSTYISNVLDFYPLVECKNVNIMYVNNYFYGVVQGFYGDTNSYDLRMFVLNGLYFSHRTNTIQGSINQSYSTSDYGVQEVGLSLVNIGYNPSTYPTLENKFIITYGYTGITNNFSGWMESNATNSDPSQNLLTLGNPKVFNTTTSEKFKLYSYSGSYIILTGDNHTWYSSARNLTTTNISNDIVKFDVTKNLNSSGSLSLELANE